MSFRRVIYVCVLATITFCGADALAQIKVVPREKIEQIANPQTVANSGMFFLEGRSVDLGAVEESAGVVEREIVWENRGDKPISITKLNSSCSCLSVVAVERVVAPKEQGVIRLRFNPQQRLGGVSYRVLIYSSLSEKTPTAALNITGEVLSSADQSGAYPESCGALRLMSRSVKITAGESIRVACMNSGGEPLRLEADMALSSPGVEMRVEPAVLDAGAQGDLVIRYDAAQYKSGQPILLYIKGLQLPPRQRCIVLELGK